VGNLSQPYNFLAENLSLSTHFLMTRMKLLNLKKWQKLPERSATCWVTNLVVELSFLFYLTVSFTERKVLKKNLLLPFVGNIINLLIAVYFVQCIQVHLVVL